MNPKRIYSYSRNVNTVGKTVVYWMSRDQRVWDNHALIAAATAAIENGLNIEVVFCLDINYPGANRRSFQFMVEGLEVVSLALAELNIPFTLLLKDPLSALPRFLSDHNAVMLFSDFDPLRIKQQWKMGLGELIRCAHYEVDAHNVVPCRVASQKEEFGAYTFRPRFQKHLPDFLYDLPNVSDQEKLFRSLSSNNRTSQTISAKQILANIVFKNEVKPILVASGEKAAQSVFEEFVVERLEGYDSQRNFPEKEHTSRLSAHLHFGHISAQRMALTLLSETTNDADRSAFIEQLLVRRELSDNYCFYQPQYDSINGIAPWATTTLNAHSKDEREFVYTYEQFERGETHERLWNAAQKQLLNKGYIHGYMRMYWAKKILEWSESPAEALRIAIELNDKYALDGRDPNGYVGCQWAICGIHDRAWAERPVYGKIRYMNENGCRRKFDVEKYIRSVDGIVDTVLDFK